MIQQFYSDGGRLMHPLLLASVIAFAIILERAWFWVRFFQRRDPNLRRELTNLYLHAERIRRSRDDIAKILAEFVRNPSDSVGSVLKAEAVVRDSRRHLGILNLIASISTSMGLLGTVIGVSLAFKSLSLHDATKLAEALSVALNTTVFGLVIFIPSYMALTFYSHLSSNVVLEIEEAMESIRSTVRERQEKLNR